MENGSKSITNPNAKPNNWLQFYQKEKM